MRYGIPKYRLPRERLVEEVARIERLGVAIHRGTRIDDIARARAEGGFDAVFVSTGAPLPRRIDLPSTGEMPVLDALKALRDAEEENPTRLNGDVAVIGGGNTAMDVARTAVRMGARSATVLVLEAEEHMSAHPMEVREAREEGARIENLRAVRRIEGGELILERMSATNDRWPRPLGEFEQVSADVLVQAVGQQAELTPIEGIDGIRIEQGQVLVDANMATGAEGIFAGGDIIPEGGSATAAIGQGKRAARAIDAYLRGEVYRAPAKSELARFEYLETWYYCDAPRSHRPRLDLVRRTSGFAEVVGNLDTDTAAYEARRCMSCGNCFECDNCFGVCPDNAIIKPGGDVKLAFKYDYCKGCGLCVSECPCGAIKMVPEV
jgi:2-oxoacid:acceptor oxidoreductase delta subunit (pyruvate/2-ketoisovalerate family)